MRQKFGSAVILAGGKSSRMGYDKQLIDIYGKMLIERQYDMLKAEFSEVVVVSNEPVLVGLPQFVPDSLVIAKDYYSGMGPLSGIHAGLRHSSSEYAYFIACDMPYINLDYIHFMKKQLCKNGANACVTRLGEWIEPFNAFYSVKALPGIEACLEKGEVAIHKILKNMNCLYIDEKEGRRFSPDWSMFFNINTKKDLSCYLASIQDS